MRKWKTTDTVLVKAKRQAKENIREAEAKDGENGQRQPTDTSKDLQHLAADGVTVHRSTIQRTLHKEKPYGRVMRRKPFLHTRHKQSRLRYAKAHLDKPASFWNKVLWTDETKIELFGHNKGRLCMAGERTQPSKKNTCYPE